MTSSEADFKVRFYTDRFAPNHTVTLRTDFDGWSYPLFGTYRSDLDATGGHSHGHWLFELDRARYRGAGEQILLRFMVDDHYAMEQPPFPITPHGEHQFYEGTLTFGDVPERFLHRHDNLLAFETPVEQRRFRASHSETTDYDVIVVGSGMSGGILADDLSDRGHRVLLLEAGSVIFPTHMYNLPGTWEPLKEEYFVYHHTLAPGSTFAGGVKINLGGGSLFWSGIMQRARKWEFGSHWPGSVRDYLLRQDGYECASALMREEVTEGEYEENLIAKLTSRLPDYDVAKLPRARHQPHLLELQDGRVIQQNVIRESSGMFSTIDLLLDSMSYPGTAGNRNLAINLNHMVTEIETEGRTATGVVCQDLLANKIRRYKGKIIVLAAGSLGSCRIALQSGLEDPNQMIGKGLTDHPNFGIEFDWPLDGPIKLEEHAKVMLQHHGAADNRYPYNVELMVNYRYWDRRLADEDLWRQEVLGQPKDRTGITVQFFFPSHLHDDNYVRLDPRTGKLVIYTEENNGGASYRQEVGELADSIAAEIGKGVEPKHTSRLTYFRGAQIGHAAGTLRMGGDGNRVVDDNQRFVSYDNLYAADLSVFPSVLAAKPSLTLAALTLRLAETISAQLPERGSDAGRKGIRSRVARAAAAARA